MSEHCPNPTEQESPQLDQMEAESSANPSLPVTPSAGAGLVVEAESSPPAVAAESTAGGTVTAPAAAAETEKGDSTEKDTEKKEQSKWSNPFESSFRACSHFAETFKSLEIPLDCFNFMVRKPYDKDKQREGADGESSADGSHARSQKEEKSTESNFLPQQPDGVPVVLRQTRA